MGVLFFHFTSRVSFDAMHFVGEMERFENLDNSIDSDRVEIDFVFLPGDFRDLVWREGVRGVCEDFEHRHTRTRYLISGFF